MANLEIEQTINDFTDKEAVALVKDVLSNPDYKRNNFTDTTKDIMDKFVMYGEISRKQRRMLDIHLSVNSKLWW